jgi:hypothetical protein
MLHSRIWKNVEKDQRPKRTRLQLTGSLAQDVYTEIGFIDWAFE